MFSIFQSAVSVMPTHLTIKAPNKTAFKIHLSGIPHPVDSSVALQLAPFYRTADIDNYLIGVTEREKQQTFVNVMIGPITVARFPIRAFKIKDEEPPQPGWSQIGYADFTNFDTSKFEVCLWEDLDKQLYIGCSQRSF